MSPLFDSLNWARGADNQYNFIGSNSIRKKTPFAHDYKHLAEYPHLKILNWK